MLKLLYQSVKAVPELRRAFWMKDVDAIFGISNEVGGRVTRIFRDGTNLNLGRMWFNGVFLGLDSAPNDSGVIQSFGSTYLETERTTWLLDRQTPFDVGLLPVIDGGLFLRDLEGVMKYYDPWSTGYRKYDVATGVLEDTVAVFSSGTVQPGRIHWLEAQRVVIFKAAEVAVVEVVGGEVELLSNIEQPQMAVVDTKYRNIITSRLSDGLIQIYSLKVEPNSVSAPFLTPTPTRYNTSDVTVTVLGSGGEPSANTVVEWVLQGFVGVPNSVNEVGVNDKYVHEGSYAVSPKGQVFPTTSVTDASGIARTTYCPPGNDWLSGDQELLTAAVRT